MRSPSLLPPPRAGFVGLISTMLLLAGCGGGGDDPPGAGILTQQPSTSAPSTPSEPPETTSATTEPSPEPSPEETPDGSDLPGGLVMVGDKSVFLDGFFGVRVPAGWSVTSADVPLLSTTPPGGETDLDPDALTQSLILNPDASPRGATFALVHYEHSDSVPSLDRFTPAVVKLLSGDGSEIGEPSEVTIGKQPGRLHQVTSASGAKGILVTLKAGDEYFFLLSLASESAYAGDAAEMLGSVSMVPEALHA